MGLLSTIIRFACQPAYFLVLAVAPGLALAGTAGTVEGRLEAGGRVISLSAPGVKGFRGSFAATVVIEGVTNVLSSESGARVGDDSYTAEATPYGQADVSHSTIRFEKEQVELLFRLDQIPDVPVVMVQAGIRNKGSHPVNLIAVAPLAMGAPATKLAADATRLSVGFEVVGSPADWLVTGLNNATPVVTTLASLKADISPPRRQPEPFQQRLAPKDSLEVFEYGGCYRGNCEGFLFGPVGTPVAFVAAFFRSLGQGKSGLTLMADMSGVRVEAGQVRWGQQVALLFETPDAALARWDAWVAKTHGARTAQGALSGWSSWYFLEQKVTGRDVLAVVTQVMQSGGRLRPDVIQIDRGYERREFSGSLEVNDRFPEGLPFYAGKIAETGARSGVKVENPPLASVALVAGNASQVAGMGYSYLKLGHLFLADDFTQRMTLFERYRDCYAQVRKAVGDSPYLLLNDWTQARAGLGFVDACRSGSEAERNGVRSIIEEALRAYHLNGRWFAVDNDVYYMATELKDVSPVVGGWPLARTWISMAGLSCGAAFTSDPWNEERFKPYWRNVEVLTPPAKERTTVVDLCTSRQWPSLVGHVAREWGNWTVALLWNPADKEQVVTLDFARAGLDPRRRYAVWSFWDNRYLGVAEGSYTTPFLGPSASQQLCFTELPPEPYKPVLIGSGLHIYCGAAELKRVTSLHSAMQLELTDAGAREGDLFIYSRFRPVVKESEGVDAVGLASAGENVWKLTLKGRRHGEPQRVELAIPQPLVRQAWFWLLCGLFAASLVFGGWRYVIGQRLQREKGLALERARIARDLHDDLGSSLMQIAYLGDAVLSHAALAPELAGDIDRIQAASRELTRILDETVWAIDPEKDTLDSLAGYLIDLAQELLSQAGVNCRFDLPEGVAAQPVSAEVRHHVFLAFKEVILNIIRHAQASEVSIQLVVRPPEFTLVIADNGRGFDPGQGVARPGGGHGLRNIRQRMADIGGCGELVSRPGGGTEWRLRWRLRT